MVQIYLVSVRSVYVFVTCNKIIAWDRVEHEHSASAYSLTSIEIHHPSSSMYKSEKYQTSKSIIFIFIFIFSGTVFPYTQQML